MVWHSFLLLALIASNAMGQLPGYDPPPDIVLGTGPGMVDPIFLGPRAGLFEHRLKAVDSKDGDPTDTNELAAAGVKQLQEENHEEAARLLNIAAKKGHTQSMVNLASMHIAGLVKDRDLLKAVKLLEEAVEEGNPTAENNLAGMYYKGMVFQVDYKKAADLYTQAAAQGDEAALYMLGTMYREGKGVEKDPVRAEELLNHAIERGLGESARAKAIIQDMIVSGELQEGESYAKLLPMFDQANKEKDPLATFYLKRLVKQLNLASTNRKDAVAQLHLAKMYEFGQETFDGNEVVEQNEATSLELYKLVAEQVNSDAQISLGKWHWDEETGTGRSVSEAHAWFKMAADQGSHLAKEMLHDIMEEHRDEL